MARILSYDQAVNVVRLVRYMAARVESPDFCSHEFSARCKRGIDWREERRRAPIPKHRSLVVIGESVAPAAYSPVAAELSTHAGCGTDAPARISNTEPGGTPAEIGGTK